MFLRVGLYMVCILQEGDRYHKVLQRHLIPSGQDLGGPFGFCPCIPAGVPDGPGGGMLGPIIPEETKNGQQGFNGIYRKKIVLY